MKGWTRTIYPEVKYFHDKLNECEQSLMVALNDLESWKQAHTASSNWSLQSKVPYEAWSGQGSITTKWLKN